MITKKGREVLTSVIAGYTSITDSWVLQVGSSDAAEDENQVDLVSAITDGETDTVTISKMSYFTTGDTIMIRGEIPLVTSGTVKEVGLRDSNDNLIVRKLAEKAYAENSTLVISLTLTMRYGAYEG